MHGTSCQYFITTMPLATANIYIFKFQIIRIMEDFKKATTNRIEEFFSSFTLSSVPSQQPQHHSKCHTCFMAKVVKTAELIKVHHLCTAFVIKSQKL